MLSDIEIAQQSEIRPIGEIAKKLDIPDQYLSPYGKYKAKVALEYYEQVPQQETGQADPGDRH